MSDKQINELDISENPNTILVAENNTIKLCSISLATEEDIQKIFDENEK